MYNKGYNKSRSRFILKHNTFKTCLPASNKLTTWRGTDGLDVIVLQLHSVCSQFVQHWCFDVRAVIANVVESLIIRHDENDVRRSWDGSLVRRSMVCLIFHLVWAHQVPGQITETQQAHHRKACESRCCHGSFKISAKSQCAVYCHQIIMQWGGRCVKVISASSLKQPVIYAWPCNWKKSFTSRPVWHSKLIQPPLKRSCFP